MVNKLFRQLPSVNFLLSQSQSLIDEYGYELVLSCIRLYLDHLRAELLAGRLALPDLLEMQEQIQRLLEFETMESLFPVINATGVILHTNLGRAPLAQAALDNLQVLGAAYNTLEFNIESGQRGSRYQHVEALLCRLTGAEAALVVNNNAAAMLLILSCFAFGKEVVISRGQLVEIGGGFRVPDILRQSGAILREVGTTNRTRITDYEQAIHEQSALLLRVHSSNFKMMGFVEETPLEQLSQLAHQHELLSVDDLGSGCLLDTAQFGLVHEPTVQESLQAGVDLLAFSGDKLLGGPQAGIILGNKDRIAALKAHPLARALRVDKLTYAALQTTLVHYLKGEALTRIPIWQMISRSLEDISQTAELWAAQLSTAAQGFAEVSTIPGYSTVGGGSLPAETLATRLLAIKVAAPDALAYTLRHQQPAIIARIQDDLLLVDPRTVLPGQEDSLIDTILSKIKAV